MMIRDLQKCSASAVAAAILAVVAYAGDAGAVCVGDCNADGQVLINEIVSSVNIFLETTPASSCPNADRNGDGVVDIAEVVAAVNSFLDPSTCSMVQGGTPTSTPTKTAPVATNTPTKTIPLPTNTVPAATNTPQPSATGTATRTASPTMTPAAAVCGDGAVGSGEDCDNGGTCVGGDNAGTACTSEGQCMGHGVCTEGPHIGAACADDSACTGGGKCIHCKTFGGSGCAANCTFETDVPFNLVPGVAQKSPPAILSGSGAVVHDGIILLALPLSGSQTLKVGKIRNNRVPYVVNAASVKIDRIAVSTLACACARGVVGKTCGGTVFDEDGMTLSTNCSDKFTAGASLCSGKKPCTFVNGPGNSAGGLVGCDGLEGVNLSFTQLSTLSLQPPAPPTPRPGSGPPIITLSGSGGPGSAITLNASAIGTTTAAHVPGKVCQGVAPCAATSDFGADCLFCTDDDPQTSRGAATTLPQVTGMATGFIMSSGDSSQTDHNIGPFTVSGNPLSCSVLAGSGGTPSVTGLSTAGAFTALNQPATHDIVVTNVFIGQ